jgi:hypothetical protein
MWNIKKEKSVKTAVFIAIIQLITIKKTPILLYDFTVGIKPYNHLKTNKKHYGETMSPRTKAGTLSIHHLFIVT